MCDAFAAIWALHKEKGLPLRTAAFVKVCGGRGEEGREGRRGRGGRAAEWGLGRGVDKEGEG